MSSFANHQHRVTAPVVVSINDSSYGGQSDAIQDNVFDYAPVPIAFIDLHKHYIRANAACRDMLGFPAGGGYADFQRLLTEKERRAVYRAIVQLLASGEEITVMAACQGKTGGLKRVKWLLRTDETRRAIYCYGRDEAAPAINETATNEAGRIFEALSTLERTILRLNMQPSVSMTEVADTLLQGIDALFPGSICSILRLTEDGSLRHYSAPGLPAEYIELINGTMPGPEVGSCGTAVYCDKTVIVSDIQNNMLWKDYKDIAGRFGFKACWSIPIHDSKGTVWGSFAIYHHCCKTPDAFMLQAIERLASLIGLLIENHEIIENLHESEKRYRHLFNCNPLPAWIFDLETFRFLEVNPTAIRHYGYSREEFARMSVFDIRPQTEWERFKAAVHQRDDGEQAPKHGRWLHVKKNGEQIHVEIYSHLISYKGRNALLVLAGDVTQNVLLQQQLATERNARQKEIITTTVTAQEKEKNELGNELHDNVNQLLGSAKLYFECMALHQEDKEMYRVSGLDLLSKAMEEIRRISRSMVPPRLNDVGLIGSIGDLLDNIAITRGIKVYFPHRGFKEEMIDEDLKLTIYRIVQEQTTNILKHAEASRIDVLLRVDKRFVVLKITDNGKGFTPSRSRKGIGLTNIMNRVSVYSGKADIISSPGKGCTLSVFFDSGVSRAEVDGVQKIV